MNILGQDAQMKNPKFLHLKKVKQENKKKKVVPNHYMEKNQNVLLILSLKKIKVLLFKWIKNVLRLEIK